MSTQTSSSADAVSLPSGGGALQGIGEKFTPDLQTGTGNFSVPLELPAGRGACRPSLALSYSTGSGNGPFGLGWSVGVPMISRKTSKGVPRYRDDDLFVLSGAEDLVPVPGGEGGARRYRPRTEAAFARIHHQPAEDVWVVESKDGLVSRYGAPQADGDRPTVADPRAGGRTFAWRLTETTDPNGNLIRYEYLRDRGSDASHHWDQLYLRRILYADYTDDGGATRFLVSVEFVYEDRPDPFSDHRAGFEVRTRKRCTRIEVRTHAGEDRLVRTVRLVYLDQRPERAFFLPRNGASLLSQVVVTGHDGARTESLPPLELDYTRFEPEGRRFFPLQGADLPSVSLADGTLELVDLFGNGLPDLLQMDGTVRYWRNLGGGRFDRPRAMASAPAGLRLDDPGVQLIDADGDGRTDLLVTQGALTGYYPLAFGGEWDRRSFHPYAVAPSFDLRDPEVRLVDLDGDGVTDALRAGSRLECFFSDPQEGWGETAYVDRSALAGMRDLTFTDPRVRLADMGGDGLQDVVLLRSGRVDYWPAEGRGRWGKRVTMQGSPVLPYGFDPRRVLLGDVDGDGCADLVYVDDGRVTLWINRSGNGWSEPITVQGTPRVSDLDAVRLADVLGSGIAGVLWSTPAAQGRSPLRFLDFTGGVKPYLLSEVDTHTGSLTRVEYAPSTRFYLEDEARPVTRWKTPLPFPLHVVAGLVETDRITGNRLTTRYHYRHGYWDGEEREFRGFARVDQRDTETFDPADGGDAAAYAPPLETRTWFHPGPVEDGRGGWSVADFSGEYWSEPWPGGAATSLLPTAAEMGVLLPDMPPRARRDALRTLRGQILRTELYALDGSALQDRPFTVIERVVGLREVDPAGSGPERRRVFFPHLLAERSTQWERGSDPMTGFTFAGDHDAFGQPRLQMSVAVPRGRDPRSAAEWPEPYLATCTATGYALPADGGRFIADRVAHSTTWELVAARAGSVRALRDAVFTGAPAPARKVVSQSLSYYDGEAFQGLPLGRVGSRGALMRSEQLALTPETVQEAYGAEAPPCFAAGGAPDWSGYPEELRALTPPGAGYVRREAAEGSPVVAGWFVPTTLREYDFHCSVWHPRGLVRRTRDALGRDTRTRYDLYQLLTRKTVDAAGLVTLLVHDYRTLRPRQVREPNGSRTLVAYTPLGRVESTATLGRVGEAAGDTPEAPGTRFHYDYLAFHERGEPIRVRTERRVHHANDTDVPLPERGETIVGVEYSDGFGRLLQTRRQAEDTIFGEDGFGGGVLPEDRALDGRDVAGTPAPSGTARVVVSGWRVHDNKGRVVEEYEPFFSEGWGYAPAQEAQRGTKMTQFYDSRGRVVRVLRPDGSETRTVYGVPDALDPGASSGFAPTPWEAYSYDANDNAGRTHAAASQEWAHHRDTPASVLLDALGRAVVSTARTRAGADDPVEEHRTRSEYDVRGTTVAVFDALGREVARMVHDLLGRKLRVTAIDTGSAVTVPNALGQPLETRDARGARTLHAYDVLGRPARSWTQDLPGGPVALRERVEYGDAGDPAQDPALRAAARALYQLGRPVRHYDGAGLVTVHACDFRGSPLEKGRRVVREEHLLQSITAAAQDGWRVAPFRVDWTPPAGTPFADHAAALLEPAEQRTSTRQDALGRVRTLHAPADAAGARREIRPFYNRAGALERVTVDGVVRVDHVAYDAKGQRTLIAYGNGVMTRYAYHPATFRLARLRTERYVKPSGAAPVYRPATGAGEGHPLQDQEYAYDLNGNLLRVVERTPGCGVLGNPDAAAYSESDPALAALLASGDALVRRFVHDPLGRIVSATGRERAGAPAPRPWHDAPQYGFGSGGHATPDQDNAPELSTRYTETYAYDPAGNLLSLLHQGGSGSWTRRFGVGGRTHAAWAAESAAHAGGSPWPGAPGNRLTHVGDDDAAAPQSHFFDAAGNLVRQHTDRHFTWDAGNRLVLYRTQVAASGSTPEEDRWAEPSVCALYLYDAAGQRVHKLVRRQGGAVESTVYVDGLWERQRWSRPDGTSGESAVLHVMDGEKRIALLRTGDPHPDDASPAEQYHLGDPLGSSALVLDGAGGWTNREEYTPWGETSFGSFARKRYRFTGKERDGESGLYYHGARYYAPWTCRWTGPDPAGLVDGPNVYAYVRNAPLRLVDPTGKTSDQPPASSGSGAGAPSQPKVNDTHQYGTKIPNRESLGKNVQGDHVGAQGKMRLMRTDPAGVNHYDPNTTVVLQETGAATATEPAKPHTQATFHDPQADVKEIERLKKNGIGNISDDIIEPSVWSRIRSRYNPKAVGTAIMNQMGDLFKSETLRESGRIAKKWGGEVADFVIEETPAVVKGLAKGTGKAVLGAVPFALTGAALLHSGDASAAERDQMLAEAIMGEVAPPVVDQLLMYEAEFIGGLWEKAIKAHTESERKGFFQNNPDATPTEYLDAVRDRDEILQGNW